VVLEQVDDVGLEALEALVDLLGGGLLRPAVDLVHQEDLRAVAILQGLAHADLARAFVVVPAVVHEGNAAIDGLANELNCRSYDFI